MEDKRMGGQTGLVLDIDRFSTHDGPGIRMAVFMKGCPLACRWCHSPESQSMKPELLYQQARCRACFHCVSACPQGAITPLPAGDGVRVDRAACAGCFACAKKCHAGALRVAGAVRTVDEIAEIARRDRSFYEATGGGVTVSGGEPLSQADFVLALMQALQAIPVHTALETSGCGQADMLLKIARHTDLIYYDVKHMDDAAHRRLTGVSNALILSNLRRLAADGALRDRICVRTPCIPGANDSAENMLATARAVRQMGISRMEILPYNGVSDAKYEWLDVPYPLGEVAEQDPEHVRALQRMIESEGLRAG